MHPFRPVAAALALVALAALPAPALARDRDLITSFGFEGGASLQGQDVLGLRFRMLAAEVLELDLGVRQRGVTLAQDQSYAMSALTGLVGAGLRLGPLRLGATLEAGAFRQLADGGGTLKPTQAIGFMVEPNAGIVLGEAPAYELSVAYPMLQPTGALQFPRVAAAVWVPF